MIYIRVIFYLFLGLADLKGGINVCFFNFPYECNYIAWSLQKYYLHCSQKCLASDTKNFYYWQ